MTEHEMLGKEQNKSISITHDDSSSTEDVSVKITHQRANDALNILL